LKCVAKMIIELENPYSGTFGTFNTCFLKNFLLKINNNAKISTPL